MYGECRVSDILYNLWRKKVVKDTDLATRKAVVDALSSNPKFARGKAGSTYKLRTNKVST
jgi:hypothetical protein